MRSSSLSLLKFLFKNSRKTRKFDALKISTYQSHIFNSSGCYKSLGLTFISCFIFPESTSRALTNKFICALTSYHNIGTGYLIFSFVSFPKLNIDNLLEVENCTARFGNYRSTKDAFRELSCSKVLAYFYKHAELCFRNCKNP